MKVGIVGVGRVGLPLALFLEEGGHDVIGIDINEELIDKINNKKEMPFLEEGFQEILDDSCLQVFKENSCLSDRDYIILTVGTPLLHHVETDLRFLTQAVRAAMPFFKPGVTVISRSPTAPGTTKYLKGLIEQESNFNVGKDLFLACCPERISEGNALKELKSLPQIVGAEDEGSLKRAQSLFESMDIKCHSCDFISAELVRLFNNSSRYAYFAIANALSMIALEYNAEPYKIFELANDGYPRKLVGLPGFTAGTCLRKDFGMLSESYWSGNILIESWRINESLPKFLVSKAIEKWGSLREKRIGVLGYTFKKDTDDTRDSLTPKLLRYIYRENPIEVYINDDFADPEQLEGEDGKYLTTLKTVVEESDILFIAMNHSYIIESQKLILEEREKRSLKVVDIWNCLNTDQVFL